MKKILVVLITIVFFFSCAQSPESVKAENAEAFPEDAVARTPSPLTPAANSDLYSDGKAKLIKTADYRFQVENVDKSTANIEASIRKFPAYISSSSLLLENPILENKISIRVQSEYFHELLQEIDKQALFVNFRNVKTNDVSKEFVDLDSRLKTKRQVEERYMNILRKNAGTVEELMEAEKQIGQLHEEIEATISRINYLKEQVSYSTINLEFYQTVERELARTEESIGDRFLEAVTTGFQIVVRIALGLAYLWPLILLGAGALVFLRWKNKRATKVSTPVA
jgi:peptidoglycan hydrolase CwlO-like protein